MSKTLFENISENLKHLSHTLAGIEEFRNTIKDVDDLLESINSPLLIMVMGEFSTGKSTFINALVGESIAKVDAKPTTAVITKLTYGAQDRIRVHYQDGSIREYGREEFERLTAEADDDANKLHESMDYVERTLPIDILKSMSIIDSPGLNSIKQVHEDMTRHFMDKADTVLWMFDANKPGSQTEIDALKCLNPRLTPLVLVNKIDGIDEDEGDSVDGILWEVERRFKNNKLEAQGYIGISAKWAFQGKQENKEKMIKASNIGAFYHAMEEIVLPGREQYKRNSLLDGLVKMIYDVGSRLQELRAKNEAQKDKNYAAYIETETGLATVWDELENIVDIMLVDIEQNQLTGRKRLNAAMKSFYGMIHWLGLFVKQDDAVARKYLEEAAIRENEVAQRVLMDFFLRTGEIERAKYWGEHVGLKNLPNINQTFLEKRKMESSQMTLNDLLDKKNCIESFELDLVEKDKNDECERLYRTGMSLYLSNTLYSRVHADEVFKQAANKGHVDSMLMLGGICANRRDYYLAGKWYKAAIESGSIEAQKKYDALREKVKQERKEKRKEKTESNCFITTAACSSLGKSDDCYELTAFRRFRDSWLLHQSDGGAIISEYYDVAPIIVEKIDSNRDAKRIYSDIWSKYLVRCLECIKHGDNLRCKEIYIDMVRSLKNRFL